MMPTNIMGVVDNGWGFRHPLDHWVAAYLGARSDLIRMGGPGYTPVCDTVPPIPHMAGSDPELMMPKADRPQCVFSEHIYRARHRTSRIPYGELLAACLNTAVDDQYATARPVIAAYRAVLGVGMISGLPSPVARRLQDGNTALFCPFCGKGVTRGTWEDHAMLCSAKRWFPQRKRNLLHRHDLVKHGIVQLLSTTSTEVLHEEPLDDGLLKDEKYRAKVAVAMRGEREDL
ncbi:hypothetical protein J8273_5825 [Carpediemonas membranifera]|uniref:Uncharacterized protein n=1 Tax=Carpediemonas membranifera TaxID=201153 RepID=A0A8J6ARW3_9EUKA|nr:hypothetical protein J8273_5825 [Carpediemonas membranifera]|eukprot:KAG9392791.1 hypothetical protein J8273_5825 [Carpediemonas membranifera]